MAPLVAIIGAFGTITVRSIFFDWSVHRSWFWISALRLEKSSLLTFHGPFLRKDGIPHFYGCRIHNTCASHVHEVGACGHPGTCARTPEHARGIREHRHDCRHARLPEHMHASRNATGKTPGTHACLPERHRQDSRHMGGSVRAGGGGTASSRTRKDPASASTRRF